MYFLECFVGILLDIFSLLESKELILTKSFCSKFLKVALSLHDAFSGFVSQGLEITQCF